MKTPPGFRGVFRTDLRARAAYAEGAGIYRIVPAAVAVPSTVDDLAVLVRWARAERMPLIPRGAGSAVSGSSVGEGILLDLTRLEPQPLSVDRAGLIARTGAAVTHAALAAAAGRAGLRLPPDPSSSPWATLGGMVATNAAGPRSLRHGSVRRWVRALHMVTADGDVAELRRGVRPTGDGAITRFLSEAAPTIAEAGDLVWERFPKTRKNASGYALDAYVSSGDLLDLMIGSEGTLGIITEIEWALAAVPARRAALRVDLDTLASLADVILRLHPLDPSAIELIDRTFLDVLPPEERSEGIRAVLLIEFEGEDEDVLTQTVHDARRRVAPLVERVTTATSGAAADRLWAVRHGASPILAGLPEHRRSLQVVEDGCVPLPRLAEYLDGVSAVARAHGLECVIFGHAGDGHLHVNVLPDVRQPGWELTVASLFDEISELVIRLGGTPSGEHGDGRLRAGLLSRIYGTEIVELFRRIKRAFDPRGILNPGVILPDRWEPLSQLKAGAEAAVLPEDIADGLRNIERTAGYARSRLALADEATR